MASALQTPGATKGKQDLQHASYRANRDRPTIADDRVAIAQFSYRTEGDNDQPRR
jgi:hypothetical protein